MATSANPPLDEKLLERIHADQNTNTGIENKKLIMWLFLASDCMFFGTLISTHLIYRKLYPFGHPQEGAVNITGTFDIELTSFSTFILLMSSFLMALAVSAMHKGAIQSFRNYTFGVILFGLVFLGGQVYEFQHFFHGQGWYEWKATAPDGQEVVGNEANGRYFKDVASAAAAKESFLHEHYGVKIESFAAQKPNEFKYKLKLPSKTGGEPMIFTGVYEYHPEAHHAEDGESYLKPREAFKHDNFGFTLDEFKQVKQVPGLSLQNSVFGSTFYVMTGTHGTHVAIGILWLFSMLVFSYTKNFSVINAVDVEIAGLYWHFVDIVWIVIFTVVYLVEYIPSA
ncbi:MAG: heme-copper oxidase subunit III [Verrucomicrobiota bacterium]